MSVKLHLPEAAPHRHAPPGSKRRAALTDKERPSKLSAPKVLDRVQDQYGGAWIRYGTRTRAVWNPVGDFVRQEVFTRLAALNPRLIEPAAQRELRSEIARSDTYRSALVAAAPGWAEHHFVFGDGTILTPQSHVDLVDTCVLAEAVPQAVEVVEAASVTGRTLDDEAASAKITEPLHLWTATVEAAANVAVRDQPVTT